MSDKPIKKDDTSPVSSSRSELLEFLKNDMVMYRNYQPIVIKSLLEASDYNLSESEIKNRISELNFDREDFKINQAISTVQNPLKDFVTVEQEKWSLDKTKFDESEIPEILKICGQKIAKMHIELFLDDDLEKATLWRITPGRRDEDGNFPYLDEFIKSKTIGIGWDDLGDLTQFHEEKDLTDHIDSKHPGASVSKRSINDFWHNMEPKHFVICTKAMQGIVDFGIIVGEYFYHQITNESKNYAHRRNVVWLNQEDLDIKDLPDGILSGGIPTCNKVIEKKNNLLEILLGEQKDWFSTGNFYVITQNPDSKYDDIEGKQYAYDSDKAHYKNFSQETNFVIQTKIDGKYYFVGYGKVGELQKSKQQKPNGREITKIIARFSNYQKINEKKQRTEEITKKINNIAFPNTGFNPQPPAMLEIPRELFMEIIGKNFTKYENNDYKLSESEFTKYFDILNQKNQIIFYGPPGTGKTFTAKEFAKYFIRDNSNLSLTFRSAAIKILKEEGKPLHYQEITRRALDRRLIQTEGETPEFTLLKEMTDDIQRNGNSSIFKKKEKGIYALNSDFTDKMNLKSSERIEIENQDFIRIVTFHPSYSYEDFIEGIRPRQNDTQITYDIEPGIFKIICEDAKADPNNRYVLLIDEINRGNISKIFGELITLIEKDKRAKDPLRLTYSKESFTVPKNVFIIGTMNTADRSLTQLDVALRRRFGFVELMPDYDLINSNIDGINLASLLKNLNAKIRQHEGREKQIGHSYLMKNQKPIQTIEELQFVFENEIIPLLQDYFYEDFEKLHEVLGNDYVDVKNMEIKSEWKSNTNTFVAALKPFVTNE